MEKQELRGAIGAGQANLYHKSTDEHDTGRNDKVMYERASLQAWQVQIEKPRYASKLQSACIHFLASPRFKLLENGRFNRMEWNGM